MSAVAAATAVRSFVPTGLPDFELSNIVEQLSGKPEYRDWTPERFDRAVEEYRKFLAAVKVRGEDSPVFPSHDADEIWHRHILNTRQYAADCQNYLGHYLHHRPCAVSKEQWRGMQRVYAELFGEPLDALTFVDSGSCSDDGCTP